MLGFSCQRYTRQRTLPAVQLWDLTEQIFKDIVVVTAQALRQRTQVPPGFEFTLKHVGADKLFGTKSVWRLRTKVLVSDVHRTIVDMLDDPPIGGGIQHVTDCFGTYLKRDDRDDAQLIAYGDQLGNGAVFKRLGFLAERHGELTNLIEQCRTRLTSGNAKIDPTINCNRLISRWRLFIPQTWKRGDAVD